MKKSNTKFKKQIVQYKLKDYQFLQDYEIIETNLINKNSFVAKIRNSNQKVRFIKKKYSDEYFQRFKTLYKLYKNGIILADNMFIVQECQELYFYIIQAEIQTTNSRFQNLHQYMYISTVTQEQRKAFLIKIKILIDCLHQEGQYYGGLDSRNIVIDDQKHLFLTPYSLQIELKRDCFSKAYYSPQILQKINNQQTQISEYLMLKWDIWSFGCISAQILLYNSPIFLSTSINYQIKLISAFQVIGQTQTLQQNFKNIIVNSLNKDIERRSISIHKNQDIIQSNKQVIKSSKKYKKSRYQQNNQIKELNLYIQDQEGDSELILNLHSIQNVKIENQLHMIVHLEKKYHFYIDSKPQQTKYTLNKKLTLRRNFSQFLQLLDKPIIIQLKEENLSNTIQLNLQSLILIHQGKRLWNKKLIGTYKSQHKKAFQNTKINITCNLSSPQVFIQEQAKLTSINLLNEIQLEKVKQTPQQQNKISSLPLQKGVKNQENALKQITFNSGKKKKKKIKSQYPQIPSISQISKSISFITEEFKRKLLIEEQVEIKQVKRNKDKKDEIKACLQNLLQIQH